MSRRRRAAFHEPSLVPLADMLCNTVGIIVFILIFTVLTAQGALLPKRLPIEHKTTAERAIYVCYQGRLLPLDENGLADRIGKSIPHFQLTYDNVDSWIQTVNGLRVEDDYFALTCDASVDYSVGRIAITSCFTPKDGAGESLVNLENANGVFRTFLHSKDPTKRYIFFLVYPDSLEVFEKARSIAREMHFETGWGAHDKGPLLFGTNGSDTPPS